MSEIPTETESYHRQVRNLGERYGLHSVQLNLLCTTISGSVLNNLTPIQAQLVAGTLVAMGEEKVRDWARELETTYEQTD
jgi:hypothetical protein